MIPSKLHGQKALTVAACYASSIDEGMKAISPLKELIPDAEILGAIPYIALQSMLDASAPKGIHAYWKTAYLTKIDDDAIRTLVNAVKEMPMPFFQLGIHPLGGAVSKISSQETPFVHRKEPFVSNIISMCMDPAQRERGIAWVIRTYESMERFSSTAPYLHFLSAEGKDVVKSAYGEAYPRLVEIKRKYDPENIFKLNQNMDLKYR